MEDIVIQVLGFSVGKFFVYSVAECVVKEFCAAVFGKAVIVYFALVAVDNVVCGVEGEQPVARFDDFTEFFVLEMRCASSLASVMDQVVSLLLSFKFPKNDVMFQKMTSIVLALKLRVQLFFLHYHKIQPHMLHKDLNKLLQLHQYPPFVN